MQSAVQYNYVTRHDMLEEEPRKRRKMNEEWSKKAENPESGCWESGRPKLEIRMAEVRNWEGQRQKLEKPKLEIGKAEVRN